MKKFRSSILLLCFLLAQEAYSVQQFDVKDGDTISVKVSSKELTRFSINQGRIDKLWGVSSSFLVKADKAKGEFFLRPKRESKKIISFFVRDEFGNTYTILSTKYDIPSQTVILTPVGHPSKRQKFKNIPLLQRVKILVKSMAQNKRGELKVKEDGKEIEVWKESKITHLKSYYQNNLVGHKYLLKNIDSKKMILEEKEFLKFGKNVVAVSLEKFELAPNETTYFYIVRGI